MDNSNDSKKPIAGSQSTNSRPRTKSWLQDLKLVYLVLYNFISAILWSVVLGRVVLIAPLHGYHNVYIGVGEFAKWTQTLAGLEVLHAAIGLVRAPLLTTFMQVASRYLLVWGIVNTFPKSTALASPAYSSMLIAWSVTEVIRYSYFTLGLSTGIVPGWMGWLRYNTFFVLYPLGISSECWLVYKATGPARVKYTGLEGLLWLILAIYVPGSYILFTHMMAQRRKVMRGLKEKKEK